MSGAPASARRSGLRLRCRRLRDTHTHEGVVCDVGEDSLRFLLPVPLLEGERVNIWLPDVTGAFHQGVVRVSRVTMIALDGHKALYQAQARYVVVGSTLQAPNRRHHPRIPADFHCSFNLQGDDTRRRARVLDVSAGGMRLITPVHLESGALIVVHVPAAAVPQLDIPLAAAMIVADCRLERRIPIVETRPPVPAIPQRRPSAAGGPVSRVLKSSDLERLRRERFGPALRRFEVRARFVIQ